MPQTNDTSSTCCHVRSMDQEEMMLKNGKARELRPSQEDRARNERAIALKISHVHLHITYTDAILYFYHAHTDCRYCQSTDYQSH